MKERTRLFLIVGVFADAYLYPVESSADPSIRSVSLYDASGVCQGACADLPYSGIFIAGAIAIFVSYVSVLKYLGVQDSEILSYSVASISGAILAVCSCTLPPLFAGIYPCSVGSWSSYGFFIFRSGHQCSGHHLNGPNSWRATGLG